VQRILTASLDRSARVWDAASGQELARLTHTQAVRSAAFSPGAQQIGTASADSTARLWATPLDH